MDDFGRWLAEESERRGWTQRETARRAGISQSMYSKVVSGFANPGLDFCRGLALAFNMPLDPILRRAGILPEVEPTPEEDAQLLTYFHELPSRAKRLLLAVAHEMWSAEESVKREG